MMGVDSKPQINSFYELPCSWCLHGNVKVIKTHLFILLLSFGSVVAQGFPIEFYPNLLSDIWNSIIDLKIQSPGTLLNCKETHIVTLFPHALSKISEHISICVKIRALFVCSDASELVF